MQIHAAVFLTLREVAEELFGSLAEASRAAKWGKDQLGTQLRGARGMRLDHVSDYLVAWGYPQDRFLQRVTEHMVGLRGSLAKDMEIPESFLQRFTIDLEPETPELKLALAMTPQAPPSSKYAFSTSDAVLDIESMRGASRAHALFLANRALGDLILRAEQFSNKVDFDLEMSSVLSCWSVVSRSLGRYKQGALALQKALEFSQRHPISMARANVLHRVGKLTFEFGCPQYGLSQLNEAMRIHSLGTNSPKVAAVVLSQGVVQYFSGMHSQAHASFKHVLAVTELEPIYHYGAALMLSRLHVLRGDLPTARDWWRRLEHFVVAPDGQHVAAAIWVHADLLVAESNIEAAVEEFRKLLPLAFLYFEPHEVFLVFVGMAQALIESSRFDELSRTTGLFQERFHMTPEIDVDRASISVAIRTAVAGTVLGKRRQAFRHLISIARRLANPATWLEAQPPTAQT